MKGEQIAVNRTAHSVVELHTNSEGEYYAVIEKQDGLKLIRGEYLPLGNRLQFPNKWGNKPAAISLIEHKIGVQKANLESARIELEKLERCLNSTKEWPD